MFRIKSYCLIFQLIAAVCFVHAAVAAATDPEPDRMVPLAEETAADGNAQPPGFVDSSIAPEVGFRQATLSQLRSEDGVDLIVEYRIPFILDAVDTLRFYNEIKDDLLSWARALRIDAVRDYSHLPMNVLHVRSRAALEALRQHPLVKGIYENQVLYLQLTESLPLINQPTALTQGASGNGTTVAVLDTGVDYTRSAFGSCSAPGGSCKVVFAQDFAPSDGSRDANGHGTNVAGIVLGVAPQSRIAALDVFTGSSAYSSDTIAAINWTIANRDTYNIVALNLSLGSGGFTAPCASDVFATPLASARAAGILPAASSGNNAYTNALSRPACVPDAVSVGAVYDANLGQRSWTACTDSTTAADQVTCFSNSASFLSLLAPGAVITAANLTMAGTSMAAPHVAGAAAALRGLCATATPDNILSVLQTSGRPIRDSRNNITKPRIDLAAAAQIVRNTCVSTRYSLNVSKAGNGNVSSGAGEIDCGSRCSSDFISSSSVALTANPDPDYRIGSWGGACGSLSSSTNVCTLVMDANKDVFVQFVSNSSACPSTPLGVGSTLSGTLAATDCRSPKRTSAYADNFTFTATAGVAYTIDLSSTAFDAYLYLLNSAGATLASNDDAGGSNNSRIVYTPTTGGTLTIHATSYGANATGAYTVALRSGSTPTVPAAPSGLAATASSATQVNLAWTDNSSNETGFKIERRIGAGGSWTALTAVAANVRAYSNTGLTAGTTYYYRVRAYNSAGESANSNEAWATPSGGGACSSTTISVGSTVNGTLATSDCRSPKRTAAYADNFTFTATAGVAYTIDLSSTAFDAYLYLLDSAGATLAQNDDAGGGFNSRIAYTPTTGGTLTVHATSYGANATGAYTVTLQ